jgi:hypothetical protein
MVIICDELKNTTINIRLSYAAGLTRAVEAFPHIFYIKVWYLLSAPVKTQLHTVHLFNNIGRNTSPHHLNYSGSGLTWHAPV